MFLAWEEKKRQFRHWLEWGHEHVHQMRSLVDEQPCSRAVMCLQSVVTTAVGRQCKRRKYSVRDQCYMYPKDMRISVSWNGGKELDVYVGHQRLSIEHEENVFSVLRRRRAWQR